MIQLLKASSNDSDEITWITKSVLNDASPNVNIYIHKHLKGILCKILVKVKGSEYCMKAK